MKNIVIINSFYSPDIIGGAEISTKILAESLTNYYKVHVLCVGSVKKLTNEYIDGVSVWRIPGTDNIWYGNNEAEKLKIMSKVRFHINNVFDRKKYFEVKEIINKLNPIFIHTQNLSGFSTSIWKLADNLNIPIVHTIRDYNLLEPTKFKLYNSIFRYLIRKRSNLVDVVTGVSNYTINAHTKAGFFYNSKKNVVPNAVKKSTGLTSNTIKSFETGPLTIGYFGQLTKTKGIEFLLKTVTNTDNNTVGKLLFFGDGIEREKVLTYEKKDKRIVYKGKLTTDSVIKEMSKVDLIVVPSIWEEPFGRIIIEAYQVGTPVLASNVGGIPDVIFASKYLFKSEDESDLKTKLEAYIELSIEEKKVLSQELIKHSNSFSEKKLISNHLAIYQEIL